MKKLPKQLTYANVMSTIAVFLVLGGATAFAASHLGKNSVGSKQLKKNSVTVAKIKKGAVSTTKIKNGAVSGAQLANGAVGSAQLANGSVGAGQLAAGAAGNAQTQLVKVFKAGAVPTAASEATAPKVELGSVGPFNFYGKCFYEEHNVGNPAVLTKFVQETTYIELTSGTATFGSEGADASFGDYLTPATQEFERELMNDVEASTNTFSSNSGDEEFQASASNGTEITGEAGGTGAKQGNPAAGNGPFLAGDSCIVGAIAVFGD